MTEADFEKRFDFPKCAHLQRSFSGGVGIFDCVVSGFEMLDENPDLRACGAHAVGFDPTGQSTVRMAA